MSMTLQIDRRALLIAPSLLAVVPHAGAQPARQAVAAYRDAPERAITDAQWRARLSPAAYNVLRRHATERAGTSPLNAEHRTGVFQCAGCALPLFQSSAKFESGTGWPSFYRSIAGALGQRVDRSMNMERTEYHCARCLGHQGHVFDDGPRPTGLRYCNNGVALTFVPA